MLSFWLFRPNIFCSPAGYEVVNRVFSSRLSDVGLIDSRSSSCSAFLTCSPTSRSWIVTCLIRRQRELLSSFIPD
uniref:Uncharacterized protein n=1 Tax=Arundo donax TaxID=35708 RepID=A0A0A9CE75_ARUDO